MERCPICSSKFNSDRALQLHVNKHFDANESSDEESQLNDLNFSRTEIVDVRTTEDPGGHDFAENDIEPDSDLIDDGKSRTRTPFMKLMDLEDVMLSSLCDHFSSSGPERGRCGYKNIQMVLSAMMRQPHFRKTVFNGKDWFPSILKIQTLIELAWQSGFDPAGSSQLRSRIQNTRKWIGATEVATLFSSLSIRCRLVELVSVNTGNHGRNLYMWLRRHFLRRDSEFICPIYLQYHGHSVTIVGIDTFHQGLLVLNPSISPIRMRNLTNGDPEDLRREMFMSQDDFDEPQYQMVIVDGLMTNEREFENAKNLENIRSFCER